MSKLKEYGSVSYARTSAFGEIDEDLEFPSADQYIPSNLGAQGRGHLEQRLPPLLECREKIRGWRIPPGLLIAQPVGPVRLVLAQVSPFVAEDRFHIFKWDGVCHVDRSGMHFDGRARNIRQAVSASGTEA